MAGNSKAASKTDANRHKSKHQGSHNKGVRPSQSSAVRGSSSRKNLGPDPSARNRELAHAASASTSYASSHDVAVPVQGAADGYAPGYNVKGEYIDDTNQMPGTMDMMPSYPPVSTNPHAFDGFDGFVPANGTDPGLADNQSWSNNTGGNGLYGGSEHPGNSVQGNGSYYWTQPHSHDGDTELHCSLCTYTNDWGPASDVGRSQVPARNLSVLNWPEFSERGGTVIEGNAESYLAESGSAGEAVDHP